ncbi:hypothetical protein NDU88_001281 [Pleurodeles waltl]|uniref:Uncharacterized protein n=1 Tax=Pleurodeles waltl TaxID=8319 RepID=A0AAV7USW6_PLEWA|nr:hypothetical protein NDU88_001281 [Pleurodeles waltl]
MSMMSTAHVARGRNRPPCSRHLFRPADPAEIHQILPDPPRDLSLLRPTHGPPTDPPETLAATAHPRPIRRAWVVRKQSEDERSTGVTEKWSRGKAKKGERGFGVLRAAQEELIVER